MPNRAVLSRLMLIGATLVASGAARAPARAQSFDCAKARTSQEKAICAQPSLGALDRALADAFAAAMTRAGDGAAALRTAQTAWVRDRDARCTVPARIAACLSEVMTTRIAALAPPAAQVARTPATPPVAPPAAPPVAPAAPPAIPAAFNPPPAEATLDRTSLPATAPGDTLLHVRTAGRFALAARSASGTALQLVDMMAGPSDPAGEPGARDGRTDVLLDVGTYKLRTIPAAGATGDVQLSATPFRDAAPPAAIPAPGTLAAAALADLQQSAFWVVVGPDGRLEVDAAGRALADLRLWRGGTDLEPLQPASRMVEAVRGHPMLRLRLSGTVEPGTYLVVAYGGPPLGWADGAVDMPFFMRAGASRRLAEGWATGTVGPMGSEVFAAPARAGLFRLQLPSPAAATLGVDAQSATIAANSRDPAATVGTAPNRRVVEVSGLAGQSFTLTAAEGSTLRTLGKPGRYWVSAAVRGAGGDEVPPTMLLALNDPKSPLRVLASTVPRIGPGQPWRAQFNVRGPTTVLLQNTSSGEVTVRNASQNLATLDWRPHTGQLPADFADYLMAPAPGRQGVVDLSFGGAANAPVPAAVAHWPADPTIPFGVQTIEPGQALLLDGNTSPLMQAGLLARPVPVALVEGPLSFAQMPGVALDVPVRIAPGGTLAVADPARGDLSPPVRTLPDGSLLVSLPAPDAPRNVVLAWRSSAATAARAPIPAPPRRVEIATVGTDAPRFLDLRRGQLLRYDLQVDEGGLYRVETLGRLRTALELGTAFAPQLDRAEANGTGQNALLQRWLRAGRYRVAVKALDSAGHLGLQAAPAPLAAGAPLLPGGSVRATLVAGTGLSVPVTIAAAGRYRLTLAGLDRTFQARLDDADGWPLTAPGPLDTLEQAFAPGTYRLLVSPDAVDAALVARLEPVVDPQPIEGHGPHPLPPGRTGVEATWREPAGRDDPRVPDDWTFTLAGPAAATLRIGTGMVASLERDGTPAPVARIVGPAPAVLDLPPGAYHVRATSLGRNDRLGYRLSLDTAELQPGVPRRVAVDAQVPFTLAEPRIVTLTSFGRTPLKAVLRDGQGTVIGRYGNRADDWNIAVSRALPAGRYRLDLLPSTPPGLSDVSAPPDPPAAPDPVPAPPAASGDEATSDDTDTPPADASPAASGEPKAQTSGTPAASDDTADAAPADDDKPRPTVELTLSLPALHDPAPAPTGPATLAGGGVHRLTLPPVRDGQLLLGTAAAAVPVVLTLERQGAAGDWAQVALATGVAPVVAANGVPGAWRMAVWPLDGGTLPVTASVSVLDPQPQPIGTVSPTAVPGTAVPVFAAAVQTAAPGPLALAGAAVGTLAGGWPGHALAPLAGGTALPQDATTWLVARSADPLAASLVQAVPGQPVVLSIPSGATARLAAPPPGAGLFRAWRAESGLGQPGIDAGTFMGVAPGSALATGTAPLRAWDAGAADGEVLRPRVTALDLRVQPPRTLGEAATLLLPPMSATHLTLPAGDRRTDLSLAAGTAAVAGQGPGTITVWTGDTADARSVPGAWTDLVLLNTTPDPAPAAVAWTPGIAAAPLRPGTVVKRFFGASGSFETELDAPAGARLVLAGDAQAVFAGRDGRVQRGSGFVPGGPGHLTVFHAPGPLAMWLDVPGTSPWPAATPQTQKPAGLVALTGPAMALSLPVSAPALLHVRTSAPVILRLDDSPPVLYGAGASFARYVSRPATLRIDSPHDGPLSGTLELTADPVIPVEDGLGAPVALAPGNAVAFAFQVPAGAAVDVGVGVRADPDRVSTRLLAADGRMLGEGAALLRHLAPGRYLLEASLPPDAPAAVVRAAVVGIAPRTSGPPPDVVRNYLELAGLTPQPGPQGATR